MATTEVRRKMEVGQVIEQVKEWVLGEGSEIPGFCGTYLVGGINAMPSDEPFPYYCDVDLHIVLKEGGKSSDANLEVSYNGLILECGFKGLDEYSSPEAVLANPHIAPNLVVNSIISDPTGQLTRVQREVAEAFAQRQWVMARCAYEKERTLGHLEQLRQVKTPFEATVQLYWVANFLAGLIALASLKTPTHRKALVLMKELLQGQGHLDLHEKLLDLLGYKHLRTDQVEFYLRECAAAFDCAIEVKKTPSFWDMKLRPHVRPYVIVGAQEMMDAGYYREAMFWIEVFLAISIAAIQNDAPDADRLRFRNSLRQLFEDLGRSTPDDWASRYLQACLVKDDIFDVADVILQSNPNIID
jgi:hypothetical protein